jgi:hypothetical protein
MIEIWKNVTGHEDYLISNFGKIKRKPCPRIGRNQTLKEINITLSPNDDGYLRAAFNIGPNKQIRKFVHRLVAIHFIDNPSGLKEINHKDGDKLNNHVDNLEWCTRSYNIQHAYDTGLKKIRVGSELKYSKLDELQVKTIKTLSKDKKLSPYDIARYFKVNYSTIAAIRRGSTWKHVII